MSIYEDAKKFVERREADRAIADHVHDSKCDSCTEGNAAMECPLSRRRCGHHCDCSWTQDKCCWCGAEFGDDATTEGNGE